MAGWLLIAILRHESHVTRRLRDTRMRLDPARLRQLFLLGFPAAGQAVLEGGVFAAATALAGPVSANAPAAHPIAFKPAAPTFMGPLGVASPPAVRGGHALGRLGPSV